MNKLALLFLLAACVGCQKKQERKVALHVRTNPVTIGTETLPGMDLTIYEN